MGFSWGVALALATATLGALLPILAPGLGRCAAVAQALPAVALGPVLITFLPRSTAPYVNSALAAYFAAAITMTAALLRPSVAQRMLFASFGSSRWRTFRLLRVPVSIPVVLDGLRVAAPAAVLGALVGEWFGADRGLGVLLLSSMQSLDTNLLWGSATLAAAVSFLAYAGITAVAAYASRRFR